MYFCAPPSPCGRFSGSDNVAASSSSLLHQHDEGVMGFSPTVGYMGNMSIEWGATIDGERSPFGFQSGYGDTQGRQTQQQQYQESGTWWGGETDATLDAPPPAGLAAGSFLPQKRRGGPVVAGRSIEEDTPVFEPFSSPMPSPIENSEIEMMTPDLYDTDSSHQVSQPKKKKQKTEASTSSVMVHSPSFIPPAPLKRPGGRRSAEILPPVAPPLTVALALPPPIFRATKRKASSTAAVVCTAPVSSTRSTQSTCATSDAPGAIVSSSPPWVPQSAPACPPRQPAATASTSLRSPPTGPADRPSDLQLSLTPRSMESFRQHAETYQKNWEQHMILLEPFHARESGKHQRTASP